MTASNIEDMQPYHRYTAYLILCDTLRVLASAGIRLPASLSDGTGPVLSTARISVTSDVNWGTIRRVIPQKPSKEIYGLSTFYFM